MSIRKIPFAPGEYYHIYNRGNNKNKIFNDAYDYDRFLKLLYLSNSENNFRIDRIKNVYSLEQKDPLVSIGAYCLMPNHFHLLIKPTEIENGVSKFMHKLLTAYSMYYNTKYDHSGSLFESKFKSSYLDTDRYLKYIFSYIHLNPLKIIDSKWKENKFKNRLRMLKFLESFQYSSLSDYMKLDRAQKNIIDSSPFPNYFPKKENVLEEIIEWLDFEAD